MKVTVPRSADRDEIRPGRQSRIQPRGRVDRGSTPAEQPMLQRQGWIERGKLIAVQRQDDGGIRTRGIRQRRELHAARGIHREAKPIHVGRASSARSQRTDDFDVLIPANMTKVLCDIERVVRCDFGLRIE